MKYQQGDWVRVRGGRIARVIDILRHHITVEHTDGSTYSYLKENVRPADSKPLFGWRR